MATPVSSPGRPGAAARVDFHDSALDSVRAVGAANAISKPRLASSGPIGTEPMVLESLTWGARPGSFRSPATRRSEDNQDLRSSDGHGRAGRTTEGATPRGL